MEEKERFLKFDRNDIGTEMSWGLGGGTVETGGIGGGVVEGGKGHEWLRGWVEKGWMEHVAMYGAVRRGLCLGIMGLEW